MSSNAPTQALLCALLALALFQGCKKTTDPAPAPPANQLTDAGGLTVTLTYDKTPATTDLDLYIYRKSTYTATSNPQGANIGPADNGTVSTDIQPAAPDEDYVVVAAYKTGTAAKTYTLTFTGITDKKAITVSGSFAASLAPFSTYNYFGTPRGNAVTLTKAKNTYTVSQ